MELDQPFIGDRGEESSSETPPKLEINDPDFEEYKRFWKYMIMFNEEQAQNEKGLDLLIRHGYCPFTGLGKYENGILEPITLTGQRGTQALGCQSYEKVDVEEEIKPVPFVKSNTIGGCSPSI
ncbi:hypothetical protein EJ110_NYTH54620 [Nymphaea thermarum]|nr:hypothetical protein EJ110_NYTH54620 [Nymphaea thermarum]